MTLNKEPITGSVAIRGAGLDGGASHHGKVLRAGGGVSGDPATSGWMTASDQVSDAVPLTSSFTDASHACLTRTAVVIEIATPTTMLDRVRKARTPAIPATAATTSAGHL